METEYDHTPVTLVELEARQQQLLAQKEDINTRLNLLELKIKEGVAIQEEFDRSQGLRGQLKEIEANLREVTEDMNSLGSKSGVYK